MDGPPGLPPGLPPGRPLGPPPGVPPEAGPLAFLLALLAAALTLATAADYGVASDVPNYFVASLRQLEWLSSLAEGIRTGELAPVLDRDSVAAAWRWGAGRIPHPPLSRTLSGLGWAGLGWILDPLTAYRAAVALAYGGLVGALFAAAAADTKSLGAGFAAAAAALTLPLLFAHGHLAHTDLFLAAFWFGAAAALESWIRTERVPRLLAAGVLLGAALATKVPALLLAAALGIRLLARRGPKLVPGIVLAVTAAAVVVAADPMLWVEPIEGARGYLELALTRWAHFGQRITTEYLGRTYEFRPPWHYPFVWTVITVPLPLLGLAVLGLPDARRSAWPAVSVLHAALLYGALLLPAAPLHDGTRLFLPVFPFLCLLAGLGFHRANRLLTKVARRREVRARPALLGTLLFVLVFAIPAWRTIQYHPHQLSYFNALVGGIRGAAARGLEVTNLKEVLGPDVLADLDALIPAGAVVDAGFLTEEICFQRRLGRLATDWVVETALEREGRPDRTAYCAGGEGGVVATRPGAARPPDYVLVLRRRAQWRTLERALALADAEPAYELSEQGVPLLQAYRVR